MTERNIVCAHFFTEIGLHNSSLLTHQTSSKPGGSNNNLMCFDHNYFIDEASSDEGYRKRTHNTDVILWYLFQNTEHHLNHQLKRTQA